MRIGGMRERIALQAEATTVDQFGGRSTAGGDGWATYAIVWASERPIRGNERESGGQVAGTSDVLMLIRYREDISVEHRFVWRGNEYDIYAVTRVGSNTGLEIAGKLRQVPRV